MGLSDLFGSGIIGAAGNLLGSGINAIMSTSNTKKMIEAQKQMNQANIASQERINQQNIDFQQGINDIMRHDANNAIAIKKRDLINAGYSTANPDLQGNSIAQLGSPQLQAPQVQSEFTPEMANIQQSGLQSFADALLNGSATMADMALKKAMAREHDKNVDLRDKELAWYDVNSSVAYNEALSRIYKNIQSGNLDEAKAAEAIQSVENMKSQLRLLNEQIISAIEENKIKPEKCRLEIDTLRQALNNLRASYNEIISVTNLNNEKSRTERTQQNLNESAANLNDERAKTEPTQRVLNLTAADKNKWDISIKTYEKKVAQVRASFARKGINFDSSNFMDIASKLGIGLRDNVESYFTVPDSTLNYLDASLEEMSKSLSF